MYPYAAAQLGGDPWPGEPKLDEKGEKGANKVNADDSTNLLPYLGVALGIGLVISLCVGLGLYRYRSKHK
jgi:hypothetical protein